MKMLLAVDGSPPSLAAVRHALALREQGLALQFVLANVQPPPSLYEVMVAHDRQVLDEVRAGAGADLLAPAQALLDAAGVEYEVEVAGGDPGATLAEMAEDYGVDAVMIGARSGTPGAVAHALLQHAGVPVTLVREREAESEAEAGAEAESPA
jgi:nucleotide-binding universal stress UspA family protein